MIGRWLNPLKEKSFLLFGPRGSGKSTWLRSRFEPAGALFIDLLNPDLLEEYSLAPQRLSQLIHQQAHLKKPIVIDEIQKVPRLLDIVHKEIVEQKRVFIMSGSSSRRLKQKGVNLLAGRAAVYNIFPFSQNELKEDFDLQRALERGGLPESYLSRSPEEYREFLKAYALTYLEKEIQQEQWVRRLEPFRVFLKVAAQMNGKIVNRSKISRDCGVDDMTIASYFEILEDTLMGFFLPSFHRSVRKQQHKAPKFYFIDTGIKRALDRTLSIELLPETSAFGEAFEHWVILEIKKRIEYNRLDWTLSYLRSKDDCEIDLIIERPKAPEILVEIKSKTRVDERDAFSLESMGDDISKKNLRFLLSQDPLEQKFSKTRALFWQKGLDEIFRDS